MYGQPFTPHEWLAEVAYGASYLLLGMNGVVLLAALLISITVLLVYREILRRGVPRLIAFLLVLWCAAMTSPHWLARPHLFTFLFIAIWTPLLIRLSQGQPVPLWQFPLIMIIWANTHGAFIAGFVIWGTILVALLWENFKDLKKNLLVLRNMFIVGGSAFVVTFVNPVGWRLWTTTISYVSNRYLTEFTSEYRSIDFHQMYAWPFLAFITITFLLFMRGWKKLPLSETLLMVVWLPLALYSARNMPLFAIIAMPIMAGYILPEINNSSIVTRLTIPIEKIEHQLHGFVWPLVAVIFVAFFMYTGHSLDISRKGYQFNANDFPVGAVDWLESHPQTGNMYNFCRWGGYLIFRMWPKLDVFIDGQTDFYGEAFTRQYEQIIDADQGWQETLAEYNIQWILVPPNSTIALVLQNNPKWTIVYQDQTAVIIRQH